MATKKKSPAKPRKSKKFRIVEFESLQKVWKSEFPKEDLEYSQMALEEFKNTSREEEPDRYYALLQLSFLPAAKWRKPFYAFHNILQAGKAKFPMPPWAFQLFEQAVFDRITEDSKSLDEIFGFSSLGHGKGKRVSPVEKKLRDERNQMLCLDVWKWRVLGETVESACEKVSTKFMNSRNWNKTQYNLIFVKPKKKKEAPMAGGRKEEMVNSMRALYYRWKKGTNPLELKVAKDAVLKNPAEFTACFS